MGGRVGQVEEREWHEVIKFINDFESDLSDLMAICSDV